VSQSDFSGRLARWAIKLQGFVFDMYHRKGCYNVEPDALSRSLEEDDDIFVPSELRLEVMAGPRIHC